MTKTKLTDEKLKRFIRSGGRKGARLDFDKILRKTVKLNEGNIDKK